MNKNFYDLSFHIWNNKKVYIFPCVIPTMEKEINKKIIQKVEQNGRISFPVEFRRKFGICKGDYIEITINKIIRYDTEVPA